MPDEAGSKLEKFDWEILAVFILKKYYPSGRTSANKYIVVGQVMRPQYKDGHKTNCLFRRTIFRWAS